MRLMYFVDTLLLNSIKCIKEVETYGTVAAQISSFRYYDHCHYYGDSRHSGHHRWHHAAGWRCRGGRSGCGHLHPYPGRAVPDSGVGPVDTASVGLLDNGGD